MRRTIDKSRRDALWDAAKRELEVWGNSLEHAAASEDTLVPARDYSQRIAEVSRLLDDLGWDRRDAREEFELTGNAEQLQRTLRRFAEEASASLDGYRRECWQEEKRVSPDWWTDEMEAEWREQARSYADDDLDLLSACSVVLQRDG